MPAPLSALMMSSILSSFAPLWATYPTSGMLAAAAAFANARPMIPASLCPTLGRNPGKLVEAVAWSLICFKLQNSNELEAIEGPEVQGSFIDTIEASQRLEPVNATCSLAGMKRRGCIIVSQV